MLVQEEVEQRRKRPEKRRVKRVLARGAGGERRRARDGSRMATAVSQNGDSKSAVVEQQVDRGESGAKFSGRGSGQRGYRDAIIP